MKKRIKYISREPKAYNLLRDIIETQRLDIPDNVQRIFGGNTRLLGMQFINFVEACGDPSKEGRRRVALFEARDNGLVFGYDSSIQEIKIKNRTTGKGLRGTAGNKVQTF